MAVKTIQYIKRSDLDDVCAYEFSNGGWRPISIKDRDRWLDVVFSDEAGDSVEITNFPADQLIHGSTSVSNLLNPHPVTVSNTVTITDGGGANSLTVDTANGPITTSVNNFPVTQVVSGTVNIQDNGNSITVDDGLSSLSVDDGGASLTIDTAAGAISANIGNFPASQAVTGTFWQATQPVSIAANVRFVPAIPADADILSGSVTVSNTVTETTIITIPAGRTWFGSITVWNHQATTAAATYVDSKVRTLGTNAVPSSGTVIGLASSKFTGGAGSVANPPYLFPNIYVKAPVGNSVTITLTNSTATAMNSSATANGILL